MATQTTNYGLTKPSYNETADIGVINSNMDIIDAKMKEIDNKAGSGGTSITVDSELSDTSTNPVQNKIITQALNEKGTYSKPTGGIPKTDLASEVQTSLDKADTVSTLATEVDEIKGDLVRLGYQNYVGIGEKTVKKVIDENGGLSDGTLTDVVAIKAPCSADKITVHNVVTTGGATYRMASLMAFYKSDGTLIQFISGNDYPKENVTIDIPPKTDLIRVCVSNRNEDKENITISFSSSLATQKSNSLNYCSLGDSITFGYGVGGKSYAYYLNQILKFNRFDNIAVSGKPMYGWGGTQYENVPSDTDVFTCMMGTNDWNLNYSVANFKAQYDNLITNLVAKCPKIKIILLTTLHRDYTNGNGVLSGETNSNGVELSAFNDAVKELGVKYGLPVIDLYATCGISVLTFDTFTIDRLHPNEEGHKRIAELVANEIKKYI